MKSCPEMHRLRELLDDTLAADERVEIENHVETCIQCEEVLDNLSRTDTSFLTEPSVDLDGGQSGSFGQRFRILRRFEGGGQGDLFIARDEELERDVAVKRIKGEYAHDWRRRGDLIREALITGSLEHPGIVPVYALGYDADGQTYYAMRLIRSIVEGDEHGNTLQHAIASFHAGKTEWTLHKLLDRFLAVCNTIQYAHDQGVLHCDLKPLNIILGPYGETLVLDWGAAREVAEAPAGAVPIGAQPENGETTEWGRARLSCAATFQVTPAYASPEQLAGRIDELSRASDVYSLGAILRCLLTGHSPRRSTENGAPPVAAESILARRRRWHTRTIPRALEEICSKALAPMPQDRYASARDLGEDVGHWLADEPVSAYREGWLDRFLRLSRRHRTWTRASAAALVLVTFVSVASALLVNQARREATELSSERAEDRGTVLCEQGEVDRGVHWLWRSLEIVPGDVHDLRRINLAAWSRRLCSLKAYLRLKNNAEPWAFDRAGRLLITRDLAGTVEIWESGTGTRRAIHGPVTGARVAAFSPDGKLALIVGSRNAAELWDTTLGTSVGRPLSHSGRVAAAAFSQDGKTVLCGCDDGSVYFWDAMSGELIAPPSDHEGPVFSVAFDRDGKLAITGGADGTARLWILANGRPVAMGQPLVHSRGKGIVAVALSPDGETVLTGSVDHTARFWRARTGVPFGSPIPHLGRVEIVCFSPDGKSALTGSASGEARLSDVASGTPRGQPMRHQREILDAKFSPDGRAIVTASTDMTARIWDAAGGEPLGPALVHQSAVRAVAWSADGGSVLTASDDGSSRLWELPGDWRLGLLAGEVHGPINVFPRAEQPAATSEPGAAGRAGQPAGGAKGTPPAQVGIQPVLKSLAFDATGSVVVTATLGGTARFWDMKTGKSIGPALVHQAPLYKAVLSPDGQRVLTASDDQTARLWDSQTGECLLVLRHQDAVFGVAFNASDGGQTAVTGSADGTSRIWDLRTGNPVVQPMKHPDWVLEVAFSPDGRIALSGCRDGTLRRWDARTGELVGSSVPLPTKISKLAFSGDGSTALLCTEDGSATLVEVATGTIVGPPLLHRGGVVAAAFAHGGRVVVTGSSEGLIRVWNIASGRTIGPPVSHPEIFSLAASPDDLKIVTGTIDGELRLWNLTQSLRTDPEATTCWLQVLTGVELDVRGAIRSLSPEQWDARRRHLERLGGPPTL